MPRVSGAPEDAFHFKGSFADGWGKVTDAQSVVFQYPPNKETNRQDPPALYLQLTIQRYQDENGAVSADHPEEVLLKIQGPGKDTGTLDLAHPGNYPDNDPSKDPVDCGEELGACGNTVFAVKEGYQFNDKVKYMVFNKSLQEKGFKPDVLRRTLFSDYVGLYAYFKTETLKKFRDDMTSDPTAFMVTKIVEFPYEKTKATGAATAKGKAAAGKPAAAKAAPAAATAATAAAPKAEPADEPADAPSGESTAEDIATAIVTTTLAKAKAGTTMTADKLKIEAFLAISKHKPAVPAAIKKEVQEQLKDIDWLLAVGEGSGVLTHDDGKVTFAA